MSRLLALAVVAALLMACQREAARESSIADAPGAVGLHSHPVPRGGRIDMAIGTVRGIDPNTGTMTLTVPQGPGAERKRSGRPLTLKADAAQRGQVRVGEIVEVHYRPGAPYPRVLRIDPHAHGSAKGLPSGFRGR